MVLPIIDRVQRFSRRSTLLALFLNEEADPTPPPTTRMNKMAGTSVVRGYERCFLGFSPFSRFLPFSRRRGVRDNREPCQIQALCFRGFRVFAWPTPASPGAETHVSYAQQTCVLYFLVLPPMRVATMSASPPKRMLCPMSATPFLSHAPVAAISTSPLPAICLLPKACR